MTNRQVLEGIKRKLFAAGIDEAVSDAWLLFSDIMRMDRTEYLLRMSECADEGRLDILREAVGRRCAREPLQYVLGKAYFMGLELYVSPAVLIPRYDTEILASEALKYAAEGCGVLDMCTGSGCIALSIALKSAAERVVGADISPEALRVAEINREHLGADRVSFVQSDMFARISGSFDLLVSNPPYIESGELDGLMSEVRDYEPRLALDGHGDGLFFYRILAGEGREHLKPGGRIMMETGCNQAGAVSALLEENDYADIRVLKDLAGLDRVVCGRRK